MARIGARVHDDFNLIRWFSLTTLASVVTVSAVAAWALANFLTDRMIRQDAEITAGFVRSIVATENAYDLIFLDVQMPGMDGFELCAALKADAATRELPVIFISAHDTPEERVRAFRAGGLSRG
jgi:CheY-like chemotaxis protein